MSEKSPDFSICQKMWQMYKNVCMESSVEFENEEFYRRVFVENFDLKFHKLKKDACDKCTSFSNTPSDKITDEMYEDQVQESHQNENNQLENLKIH